MYVLQLNIAQVLSLTGKATDGEHSILLERPYALLSNRYPTLYRDEGISNDNSDEDDEHDLEKRRFNAWAGKRSLVGKRRFNAWAGRR